MKQASDAVSSLPTILKHISAPQLAYQGVAAGTEGQQNDARARTYKHTYAHTHTHTERERTLSRAAWRARYTHRRRRHLTGKAASLWEGNHKWYRSRLHFEALLRSRARTRNSKRQPYLELAPHTADTVLSAESTKKLECARVLTRSSCCRAARV